MNETNRTVLTVLLAVAAATAVTLSLQSSLSSPATAPAAAPIPNDRLDALEQRLRMLESSVPATPSVARATEPLRVPAVDTMSDRLAAIEARLRAFDLAAPVPATTTETPPVVPLSADDAVATITNPRATVADKLRAHEMLRHVDGAYTPAMVQELVLLAQHNGDGQVRADVWRCFDGQTKVPQIVPALLAAVAADADPRVREEAAETLGNYLDDPHVRAGLEQSAANDQAVAVRAKAKRTLSGVQPSQQRFTGK